MSTDSWTDKPFACERELKSSLCNSLNESESSHTNWNKWLITRQPMHDVYTVSKTSPGSRVERWLLGIQAEQRKLLSSSEANEQAQELTRDTVVVSTTHFKCKDQWGQISLNTHMAAKYRRVYTCMCRHTHTHKEGRRIRKGLGQDLNKMQEEAVMYVWWGCIWTLGSDLEINWRAAMCKTRPANAS